MTCSIQLPDGSVKSFSSCPSALDLAKSIGEGLAKSTVGVLVNGDPEVKDLRVVLQDGDRAELVTVPTEKALEVIRHSAAHVLAQAVQNLWPEVKVTIGPVIENGFYYDFDTTKTFSPEDLERIEKEMQSLIKENYEVTREVWKAKEACLYFEKQGELLKKQIIEDLGEKEVSIYKQGDWLDLCRGPHVQHLGQIGAVKVLSQSGAYWRGDSKNQQLTRIYGAAFHTKKALKSFLERQELAKENDHRKIGKKLDIFWFHEMSAGSPFFTSSGTVIYNQLQNFLREKYRDYAYEEVLTPQIFSGELFRRSGHIKYYGENMYTVLAERDSPSQEKDMMSEETCSDKKNMAKDLFLKPMNCPSHCLLYGKERRSYKNLPWRVADFGRLHRREPTGALQGLTRVKSFCQDDAHVFCRPDQLFGEVELAVNMLKEIYQVLGLNNYAVYLSTRPEDRMGDEKLWDQAEGTLRDFLQKSKLPFKENPGEGAFYGPKLDIMVRDSFGRSWQMGTFQCDFNLPMAFDLTYINEKDEKARPVMVHRAVLGSLERFIGIYLEHTRGRLPTWLCPVQAVILPLTDQREFSLQIKKRLEKEGIICKIDDRNEKLSYKIRESQNRQIPYMLIIGKKEQQSQSLSVRLRTGELFSGLNVESFSSQLSEEIKGRSLRSFLLHENSKGAGH